MLMICRQVTQVFNTHVPDCHACSLISNFHLLKKKKKKKNPLFPGHLFKRMFLTDEWCNKGCDLKARTSVDFRRTKKVQQKMLLT